MARTFIPQGKGKLMGPASPDGLTVEIHVRDRSGLAPDFYTEVFVLDHEKRTLIHRKAGKQIFWRDVECLLRSMRWTSRDTLEFEHMNEEGAEKAHAVLKVTMPSSPHP